MSRKTNFIEFQKRMNLTNIRVYISIFRERALFLWVQLSMDKIEIELKFYIYMVPNHLIQPKLFSKFDRCTGNQSKGWVFALHGLPGPQKYTLA